MVLKTDFNFIRETGVGTFLRFPAFCERALRMLTSALKHLGLLFLTAFLAGASYGQAQMVRTQLSLRGRVLDPNHAAIAGAEIWVDTIAGVALTSTLTDQKGEFLFTLEPGKYRMRISAQGFAKASQVVMLSQTNT